MSLNDLRRENTSLLILCQAVLSDLTQVGWGLVLHDRALGVEGEDIILQAYTEYLMGQDKLGLIP